MTRLIVFCGIEFGAVGHLLTKPNSATAQMCNMAQRGGGGGGRLYDLTSVTKDANREKKYILSPIGVKMMCFTRLKRREKACLLMVTHTFIKPRRQFPFSLWSKKDICVLFPCVLYPCVFIWVVISTF